MKLQSVLGLLVLSSMIWVLAAQNNRAGDPDDYLSPDLRKRVEKLKVEARESTTDTEVLAVRLDTLWQWANAYSLTGGPFPDGFPQLTANANRALRGLPQGGAQLAVASIPEFIRRYTREFQIKDEQPGAIGSLTLSPPGPFKAGEFVTITKTYTVGKMPMAEGGGIVLRKSFRGRGNLQTNDPRQANYVTIRGSNPDARFTVTDPWGQWLSFLIRTSNLPFRLSGAALTEGDTITITFGDTSAGGPGLKLQDSSNDQVILHTLLDLEGEGVLLTPKWPSFEVLGREEVRYVNAVAPSVVEPNERFTLAVRAEDRSKNLSSGLTPGLEVLLNGEPFREIAQGSPALVEIDDVRLGKPGVYRFTVRTKDGSLQATSNPVRVEANPAHRVFWGETHGHTAFAEGQGSPDGYYKFGRDVARLDFLSLSEHDIWMDDREWKTLQEMVEKYRIPGRFTTILGFEWTSRLAYGGHHNVFFRDVPGRTRVPNQKAPLLEELYTGLRGQNDTDDVLIIPHAHQAGDWTKNDGDMERLVEIQSGHGTFDWFGNKYLQNGFEVGFVGASDNHNGHPGYSGIGNRQLGGLAAVIAAENTGDAIFNALRSRATYATTGERIILEATLNGVRMGLRQDNTAERKIDCRVNGTAPIDSIDVIKNGTLVYSKRYLESEVSEATWVQIVFESSTEVFGRRQVPRGGRPWRGAIVVEGAELVSYDDPWFTQPATYRSRRDDQDRNRILFEMNTRGRGKALLLKLSGAGPGTVITVDMETTRESRGSGGYERTPQRLPAAKIAFRLGDLKSQVARREFQVLEHTDAVSAQIVRGGGALDQEFSYIDRDEAKPGDYYYLRVRQMDGSMAWSSPFWVGKRGD